MTTGLGSNSSHTRAFLYHPVHVFLSHAILGELPSFAFGRAKEHAWWVISNLSFSNVFFETGIKTMVTGNSVELAVFLRACLKSLRGLCRMGI